MAVSLTRKETANVAVFCWPVWRRSSSHSAGSHSLSEARAITAPGLPRGSTLGQPADRATLAVMSEPREPDPAHRDVGLSDSITVTDSVKVEVGRGVNAARRSLRDADVPTPGWQAVSRRASSNSSARCSNAAWSIRIACRA
jgi:hypothetical protein